MARLLIGARRHVGTLLARPWAPRHPQIAAAVARLTSGHRCPAYQRPPLTGLPAATAARVGTGVATASPLCRELGSCLKVRYVRGSTPRAPGALALTAPQPGLGAGAPTLAHSVRPVVARALFRCRRAYAWAPHKKTHGQPSLRPYALAPRCIAIAEPVRPINI
jgi:hypothetical protein